MEHLNNWADVLSDKSRAELDSMVVKGWIQNNGNQYYTTIIDSCFYDDVSFEQLALNTPYRFGGNLWAFRGEDVVEPFLFYATEVVIKFMGKKKTFTAEPFDDPFSNLNNTDLETFFSNAKIWKGKAFRKNALKEKKRKAKK